MSGNLTKKDRRLAEILFTCGPDGLRDEGLQDEQIIDYMQRTEVQRLMRERIAEFNNQDVMAARARFNVRRRLARSASDAVEVLNAALKGPRYARDHTGSIERSMSGQPVIDEPEVTDNQLKAAKQVLETLGVAPQHVVVGVRLDVDSVLGKKGEVEVAIEHDPNSGSEKEQTLSRERIRTTMELMMSKVTTVARRVKSEARTARAQRKQLAGDSVSRR